jgi:hypothetical protein
MKNRQNTLRITAAAALVALSGAASALDFSANVELDNTYKSGNAYNPKPATPPATGFVANPDKGLTQSGRVELNASGKAGANWFVAGKASFLAKKDGNVATDDMWVQVGNKAFDVKLGRFEGVDLFPLPGDVLVESTGKVGAVKTNTLRGRIGDNVFHAAVGLNISAALRAELGLVESTNFTKPVGIRPAITYANGPLTLGAGLEVGKYDGVNNSDFENFGGFAQYDFGSFKLTANAASGKSDGFGPTGAAVKKSNAFGLVASVGAANVGLVASEADNVKETTLYAAYTMPLFDVKGASITPAISTSKSGNTKANGVRVRVNYAF